MMSLDTNRNPKTDNNNYGLKISFGKSFYLIGWNAEILVIYHSSIEALNTNCFSYYMKITELMRMSAVCYF